MTLWNALKPGHPLWLANELVQQGLPDLAAALAQALQGRPPGLLPASVRPEEVAVRAALCPDHQAAVLVKRSTSWCLRTGKKCANLQQTGGDWIVCAALAATPVVAKARPWDLPTRKDKLVGQRPAPVAKKPSFLASLVKLLGPAIVGGLVVNHLNQRKLDQQRAQQAPHHPLYLPVGALLRKLRVTGAYDTVNKRFTIPHGKISLRGTGLVLEGPDGVQLAPAKTWPTDLVQWLIERKRNL